MKEFMLIAAGVAVGWVVKSKIEENKRLKEENAILKAKESANARP